MCEYRRLSQKRFIGRTAPVSGWRRSLDVHQKSTICRDVAPNLSDPMVAVPAIVSIARNGKVAEMVISEPTVVPDRDGHTMSSSASPSTQSDRGSHVWLPPADLKVTLDLEAPGGQFVTSGRTGGSSQPALPCRSPGTPALRRLVCELGSAATPHREIRQRRD